jgi:hypothetical protein
MTAQNSCSKNTKIFTINKRLPVSMGIIQVEVVVSGSAVFEKNTCVFFSPFACLPVFLSVFVLILGTAEATIP